MASNNNNASFYANNYGFCASPLVASSDSSIDNLTFYYGKTSSPKTYNQQSTNWTNNYYQTHYNYSLNYFNTPTYTQRESFINTNVANDSAYQSLSSSNSESEQSSKRCGKRKLDETSEQNNENGNTSTGADLTYEQPKVAGKKPKVLKLENEIFTTQCSTCNIEFNSAAKCLLHIHKHHNNRSSTECPICYKKFGNQANTLVHVKAHTQEKTFKCQHCDNAFGDSSTLKKHLRTHTGERPFVCNICQKSFTQSGNLKRHLVVHEKYDAPVEQKCNESTAVKSEPVVAQLPYNQYVNNVQPYDFSNYYYQNYHAINQHYLSNQQQLSFNFNKNSA